VASHPYISGAGNIAQMIGYLRKNFPATVTSETVKKFSLASNNESAVINALQFIGVIDQDGKRSDKAHKVFVLGDADFAKAFEVLIREAYKDLFDLRGDTAWTLSKGDLATYFRTTDKTSEVIGERQANVFMMFRGLAGYEAPAAAASPKSTGNPKSAKPKASAGKKVSSVNVTQPKGLEVEMHDSNKQRNMALTVRIEINLPAGGSKETYDNIFKSIRANLIDE
jgi:Family of unknown function (DUF5343)